GSDFARNGGEGGSDGRAIPSEFGQVESKILRRLRNHLRELRARSAVKSGVGYLINLQHRPVERDAGKEPSTARIGENLGVESSVRRGRGVPPDRSRGGRRVGADGKLPPHQVFDAGAGPKNQHDV